MAGVTTVEGASVADILGPLERRVMARLWAHGAKSVGEVLEALNAEGKRPLAYTTVMTILVRLQDKGYLTREREGRHFRYAPAVDESSLPAQAGRRELSRLIERYGADSVAEFAADLGEGALAERLASMARMRTSER
jgi:predicted transcriptional regulator